MMTDRAVLASCAFLILSRLFPLRVNCSMENAGRSGSSASAHQCSSGAGNWPAALLPAVSNCLILLFFSSVG